MAESVIVYDKEYEAAAAAVIRYGASLSQMIERYLSSLQIIVTAGICDHALDEKLNALADQVAQLQNPIRDVVDATAKLCTDYVQSIDEADRFLA